MDVQWNGLTQSFRSELLEAVGDQIGHLGRAEDKLVVETLITLSRVKLHWAEIHPSVQVLAQY